MRKIWWVGFVLSFLVVGCSVPQSATRTPLTTPSPIAKAGKIRASLGGLDVTDIPYLMALDKLKTQGYTVETTQFDQFELITAAMTKGDLDIAGASRQTTWAAIAKGAPIEEIVPKSHNYYYLVVKQDIATCADLNGKTIAVGATGGVVTSMVDQYLKDKCPGVTPQIIVIPSTTNRTAALLAGQIDASPLALENLLQLERDAPGRFHALVDFDKVYPQIDIVGYFVTRAWATAHPDAVKDFLRDLIEARRQIQDKQVLHQEVVKYFGADDTAAQETAAAYVDRNMWDVNGGLTMDNVQWMIDFLAKAGDLKPGLKAADVADAAFLTDVLDGIGRK